MYLYYIKNSYIKKAASKLYQKRSAYVKVYRSNKGEFIRTHTKHSPYLAKHLLKCYVEFNT